ncbi:MAG: hypothetical protein M3Y57_04760 [Acidobacteriota bacterium]|nr:hypothetical protein [Acidobacteriota bacterium]
MKARLDSPFNPASPAAPLETQRIEGEYLKLIAASLPERKGEALVDAAQTVFVQLAQWKEATEAEFAAAREVLITHFGEVNEFNVDWLLNAYGGYLQDRRIVPALEQILQKQHYPTLNGERTAVIKQLGRSLQRIAVPNWPQRFAAITRRCSRSSTMLHSKPYRKRTVA